MVPMSMQTVTTMGLEEIVNAGSRPSWEGRKEEREEGNNVMFSFILKRRFAHCTESFYPETKVVGLIFFIL